MYKCDCFFSEQMFLFSSSYTKGAILNKYFCFLRVSHEESNLCSVCFVEMFAPPFWQLHHYIWTSCKKRKLWTAQQKVGQTKRQRGEKRFLPEAEFFELSVHESAQTRPRLMHRSRKNAKLDARQKNTCDGCECDWRFLGFYFLRVCELWPVFKVTKLNFDTVLWI